MKLNRKQVRKLIEGVVNEMGVDNFTHPQTGNMEVQQAIDELIEAVVEGMIGEYSEDDPSASELGPDAWEDQKMTMRDRLEEELNDVINDAVSAFTGGEYYN